MYRYKRVFLIVMDSLGIGAMPDSDKFGDFGVDTLGHIAEKMGWRFTTSPIIWGVNRKLNSSVKEICIV